MTLPRYFWRKWLPILGGRGLGALDRRGQVDWPRSFKTACRVFDARRGTKSPFAWDRQGPCVLREQQNRSGGPESAG
jgi:hypothetical protein